MSLKLYYSDYKFKISLNLKMIVAVVDVASVAAVTDFLTTAHASLWMNYTMNIEFQIFKKN